MEAGKLELEPDDFDLGGLLGEIGASNAFPAREKGLELICPADPVPHLWVHADSSRIRQVLTNLLSNAIKFTRQGEVAVHCEVLEQDDAHTRVRISVADTGIGLNPKQQTRLFQRFSQADSSTTRQYGGTGLGLAISKQLIELMGGEIGVQSVPGRGSTFWFTLDLGRAVSPPPAPAQDALHGHRLLVVEHNRTHRALLRQLLDGWRVEHGLATDGKTALASLKTAAAAGRPYDIVLIDLEIPGLDGVALGDSIKHDNQLADTRLVVLTSRARRGDARKYESAGFAGFLGKPIEQSTLYHVLLQVSGIAPADGGGAEPYPSRKPPRFKARILVAEDNVTNQAVARSMLEKFGIRVDIAENGEEALRRLERCTYDLVFMDCQMPVMDGFEASRRIRDPHTGVRDSRTPILAMTANAMRGDREKCLAAGMDDHIAKPIDPTRLRHALEQWLPDRCRPSSDSGQSGTPPIPGTRPVRERSRPPCSTTTH